MLYVEISTYSHNFCYHKRKSKVNNQLFLSASFLDLDLDLDLLRLRLKLKLKQLR